jgi:DNA topoisomerase I
MRSRAEGPDTPPKTDASSEPAVVLQAKRHARATGLLYVSDQDPGIARRRRGQSFIYLDARGRRITSPNLLERIRRLAIPPAYTDVWICRSARGHIQATGRDVRGRKQYRYHEKWRTTRDGSKFSRMIEFAARLPKLRRTLKSDLARPGLPQAKVLAALVNLLEQTLIRVGNEEYARSNKSYGLTTLRDHHVKFLSDGRAYLSFRGKSGKRQELVLDDRRLAGIMRRCQQLPGQRLFQYIDDEGKRQRVDSGMVNEYLRAAMGDAAGEGFTAKDFRTWGATVRAIAFLACRTCHETVSERAFKRCVVDTARHVAESLGNTAAVCRKSYINPVVFTAWRAREIERHIPRTALAPRKLEKLALNLLRAQEKRSKPATRRRTKPTTRATSARAYGNASAGSAGLSL